MVAHRKFTDEEFITLYEQGLNDCEMARKLGVNSETVRNRRCKLGLEANWRVRKFTDAQLIELRGQGFNDIEIARMLGVARSTVRYWRCKLGLEANWRVRKFTDAQLIKLHEQGLNNSEIARMLGVPSPTVRFRMGKLGLKTNYIKKKWTRQTVIEELNALTDKLGRSPTTKDGGKTFYVMSRRIFGSWNKAKEAAGLEVWDPQFPRVRKSEIPNLLYEIKNSLESIERKLGEKDTLGYWSIHADFRYIKQKLGEIFIRIPELAEKLDFGTGNLEKRLKRDEDRAKK